MSTFVDAYERWRQAPFPEGSSVDALDAIHADLVLADTWVAESVIPYVERGRHAAANVDMLGELQNLRTRVAVVADRSLEHQDAALARSYEVYSDLLSDVYRAFLEQGTKD